MMGLSKWLICRGVKFAAIQFRNMPGKMDAARRGSTGSLLSTIVEYLLKERIVTGGVIPMGGGQNAHDLASGRAA